MHTTTTRWPVGVGLGLACAMALALLAPDAAWADAPTVSATPAPPASPQAVTVFSRPVDSHELADLRGGAQQTHNDMTLAGTTADNSAYQVTTGSNAITAGSFANMSGIPVVIQNTGANVLIQNAVILNLQMN